MITTIQEAVDYMKKSLHNMMPDEDELDDLVLREIIEDKLLEKLEPDMKEADYHVLEEKLDDDEYVDNYLQTSVPNFYKKLEESVAELLAEYLMPDEDEASPTS